ncbi:MAG: hypothetical protein GWM92_17845, partial [Gemmatimonadetes bacterium]|nr:hypothetical protein [Gemmatimonadota bacterium]NIR80647.1 hypothetical protein [Gemmatimonadota bacterium]NIT89434.1 hypothetical protein [Gemmatimonadota bacterium]NIU33241.1 hypothetical protein [Gemmatimonadota bacterium]NIU37554.1 hypothetical protein [Gemmatimonadota bacterium]
VLATIRKEARFKLKLRHVLGRLFRVLAFQNERRASVNVSSHYDISQEALNVYLDRTYMSYSSAIFEEPD